MNRRVVADRLDVAGAAMAEAGNGEIGLAAIDRETFDLVLLDLRMPGMDGFEVIRRIRARADSQSRLPEIVLTADAAVDLPARCLALGANAMLFKPVAMDALFEVMGRVLASAGSGGVIG